jgi:hypothetical protein
MRRRKNKLKDNIDMNHCLRGIGCVDTGLLQLAQEWVQ